MTASVAIVAYRSGLVDTVDRLVEAQGGVAITARAVLLNELLEAIMAYRPTHDFTAEVDEDALRQGRLGSYRGADLLKERNYRESGMPLDEIWITSAVGDRVVLRVPDNEYVGWATRDAAKVGDLAVAGGNPVMPTTCPRDDCAGRVIGLYRGMATITCPVRMGTAGVAVVAPADSVCALAKLVGE